jgi:hypothetical protein
MTATAEESQRLLGRLRSGPTRIWDEIGLSQHASSDSRGGWSLAQVLGHLADAESVWQFRVKACIAEDRPHLPGWDQDRWAKAHRGSHVHGELERWTTLRTHTVEVLGGLDPAGWGRMGIHAERGEISIADMARILADHDEEHRHQIHDLLAR